MSIGTHVSDVTKPVVQPTRSVQDILAAHPVNNPIWDHTDACDISFDTVNSTEALAGSHIVEPEFTFRRPFPAFEDIELFVKAPSGTIQNNGLYHLMDNYGKWDNLPYTTSVNSDT